MSSKKDRPNDDTKDDKREEKESGGPFLGEAIKKLVTAGIGAAFMTEESVRSFVSELRLPKETLNMLLAGASKSKEELTNRVGREVINIISKIDFVKEASRFVEEHKFKITAEVEVTRKDPKASESAPGSGSGGGSGNAMDSNHVEVRVQKKDSSA